MKGLHKVSDYTSWLRDLAFALALTISPVAVSSATFIVTDGRLSIGWACETSNAGPECALQSNFDGVPGGPITGTITHAGGIADLDIALTLHSATLSGGFGAVTDIVFTNVSLTNTQTAFEPLPNTIQGMGSTGTVAGTYELFDGGGGSIGGPQAFSLNNALYSNLSCLIPNPSGQCGFTIGGANNFVLDIDGTDHTFDLTFGVIVPEPGTAALLALGLAGMAIRRQR